MMKRMRRHILAAVTITAVLLTAVPGAGGHAFAQGAQEMAAAADGLLAEQRLNTWYSQAIRSISEEDYENALMCLNGCEPYVSAGDNPTLYADIYLKRGYCLLMLGRQQEALDALDKALKTDPDLSNAQLLKVSAYSDLGEYGKAIAALEKYIRKTGDSSMYETMSQLYEAAGKMDEAYESYRKFAEGTAGTEAEADLLLAQYWMRRGDYAQAVDILSASIEAGEPADGAYYNRGLCRMTQGDYETAVEDFGMSAEAEENDAADAVYRKASCEMGLLLYEDAIADYGTCIENGFQTEDSRISRGICFFLSGDGEAAMSDFNECIESETREDEARYYRSYVFLASGDYESALEDLTKCIEDGYDPASCYLQRAQVYREMGNEEASQADMEAAAKAQEGSGEAAETEEEAETEAETPAETESDVTAEPETDA